jgi:23S rRNA (adenine2503-C2)-methyltransferase
MSNRDISQLVKTTLLGLDKVELRSLVSSYGFPAYRGSQLSDWLYRHGVQSFKSMHNLPPSLLDYLTENHVIGRSSTVAIQNASDETYKLLLEHNDGVRIETVGLPAIERFTCCVSTQVGCPVGCVFCATGQSGFVRNLTAGEIVDQVLSIQEQPNVYATTCGLRDRQIDHITFMGMGEPLLNYEATLKAVRLFNNEMGIAMRHLTISTVGFIPGIQKLAREKLQLTLAISLHAPTDNLRQKLVPGMASWSIADIIAAAGDYFMQTGRRVTYEYCLLGSVNDSTIQARALVSLLKGQNCHVNLIPYNPVDSSGFHTPRTDDIRAFREVLEEAGIQVTQRVQRGPAIDAACGQLRYLKQLDNTPI